MSIGRVVFFKKAGFVRAEGFCWCYNGGEGREKRVESEEWRVKKRVKGEE
jgi:hypothetical protein